MTELFVPLLPQMCDSRRAGHCTAAGQSSSIEIRGAGSIKFSLNAMNCHTRVSALR
jgi:hypothetical protein